MPPDNAPDPKPVANAKHEELKETFSKEYVSELRQETVGWRTKAQELEKLAKDAEEAANKKIQESELKISEATTAANARIIRSELKAFAIEAGMIDLDVLKLVDLSGVKLLDDGEVDGAKELIEKLKESKPHFFKEYKSTTHPGEQPKPKETKTKSAVEMSPEEYQKHKAKLLKS